jgi:flagellar biosynthetic protein FlhB
MAEQDLDRSEAATPFKLQKAHERGQVARSMDVVSATVFAAAAVFLAWQGWDGVMGVTRMFGAALSHAESAGTHLGGAALWQLVGDLTVAAAGALAPFMFTLVAAAVVGNLVQTGPIWSMEPLKADLDRINPASGFKRLFTMRTLFDAARACLKLAVLLAAAWLALKSLLPQFFALAHMDTLAFFRTLVSDCADLALKMAAVLALIAAADWGYTRREFGQKMRMSRRELKDEYKNREGDPRIRSRLRDLRRELLKRSLALRNTGSADVVLTNPTHYAVALRYVHGEMEAPRMVAKGAGQLAAAMRELAYRRRIPVVQNPLLTRKLFRGMDIEDTVPRDFHAEVARIIVWVFAMREDRRTAAQGAPA